MLKIKKDDSGKYYCRKESVNLKSIGNLVREGYDIEVTNEHGIDITKETLFSVAFIAQRTMAEAIDGMCFLLTKEELCDIVEEGGIREFMSRKRKDLI